jgi:hypothetical protein
MVRLGTFAVARGKPDRLLAGTAVRDHFGARERAFERFIFRGMERGAAGRTDEATVGCGQRQRANGTADANDVYRGWTEMGTVKQGDAKGRTSVEVESISF